MVAAWDKGREERRGRDWRVEGRREILRWGKTNRQPDCEAQRLGSREQMNYQIEYCSWFTYDSRNSVIGFAK